MPRGDWRRRSAARPVAQLVLSCIPGRLGSRLSAAGIDAGDDRHTGTDLRQALLAGFEGDAHRDALDHLGEVAGRGVLGQQGKGGPGGGRDALHMAPEGVAGEGIDEDLHGLAHPDVADLGLLVVGDDVGGHVQHQRDDLHAFPDQIPHLYLAGAGMAVARGGDDGVPQVDEGALQLGFRGPKIRLAQLPVGLLQFELAFLHPDFGQGFTVAVLGRAQVDLRRVRLTRGNGIALEELLHAGVLAAGQIEAGRRLAELAPVEPEPEADPESDAAEAGENDRNALVMAHVRKYMEDNYMFDLSLDSVSEILHISPAYLSAQFKKYQKMNFLDCLTELRINAAKELLTDPFRSAAEVASMVGYEDSSYFARTFKKRTGMTPTQYRREAAKAAREARL